MIRKIYEKVCGFSTVWIDLKKKNPTILLPSYSPIQKSRHAGTRIWRWDRSTLVVSSDQCWIYTRYSRTGRQILGGGQIWIKIPNKIALVRRVFIKKQTKKSLWIESIHILFFWTHYTYTCYFSPIQGWHQYFQIRSLNPISRLTLKLVLT